MLQETQSLIKDGQRLEEELQQSMGVPSHSTIHFPNTSEIIVESGEVISSHHVGRVQQYVKTQFEQIEKSLKQKKQLEKERLSIEIERLQAEIEQKKAEIQNQYEDQLTTIRAEYNRQRNELLELNHLTFMSESRYRELKSRWGQVFRADMGAEAFYDILRRLDLDKLYHELWVELRTSKSKQKRKRAIKRLKVVKAFKTSGNRPEWMILTVLPLPPDLRPMVQLDGGRFATSD
jgi:DNA-directed RNA polymerase subunit beta'